MKKTLINSITFLALLHDVAVATIAWGVAFLLRFNFSIPIEHIHYMEQSVIWVVPLQGAVFISFSLYRGMWRFASLPDLKRILFAVSLSAVLVTAMLFMFQSTIVVPRSVLVLDPLLLMLMMGGSRFAYRAWREHQLFGVNLGQGTPVVVLGSGDAAVALVKDLVRSQEWHVVGLLGDDESVIGREIMGVKVLGNIEQLPSIAKALDIRDVIVAKPSDAHQARRRAVEIASKAGLNVLTVPSVEDLMSGKVKVSKIRQVEIEDLLGRDAVSLDNSGLQSLINGQVVLVSGAGGSIGSELCRQIVKYKPATLICLDISEFSLYVLEQELSALQLTTTLVYKTCDVKNRVRINHLLTQYQPTIVFHAAAYKHVPMMENGNVWEALSNNVIGTYTLASACKEAGVAKFVLISTDKAVNPTNVMGASKRLAEMVCQGLQEDVGTRFVIVRFGNVLGSSGSVIPKFREQIAKGGPITITHPEITRYFMSIPEAAQLVMQAGLMGAGGEIFVLDMGEPVKIVALAADMIRLSGLALDEIEIEFVGLRPGEKLYEELLADDEHTMPTPHEKLRIAKARTTDTAWVNNLLKWIESAHSANESLVKAELAVWVEEYSPQYLDANAGFANLTAERVVIH
ncbi:UDP-N-acetyl-alpha-D-glucosamine C6 dehydratase [mine drainage metagenome]|uniref:UDP-N-acetyl-alpha-D-glucosamine C6 dehydratase n=1 Tax=mine drainage metagenome TaxID=410659 RepID=A0A1J5S707_9ZZZZ